MFPKGSPISKLIITWCYKKTGHAGRGMKLNEIWTSGFWIVFANSATHLQSCNFIEKRLQRRCFPVQIANFYLFWNLRTASSDYSFTLVIYFKKNYDLLWWGKWSFRLDYMIQWSMILKGMSESLKYTWRSLMYRF